MFRKKGYFIAFLLVCTILIFKFSLALILSNNDILVYDGEIGSAPLLSSSCINSPYMQQLSNAGLNSGNGLKLSPDTWNAPAYRIYCGGMDRMDLTKYTDLVFYIKTNIGTSNNYLLWLNTFANPLIPGSFNSPTINIASYVQGGVIDTSWKKVNIPLSALKTLSWDLVNTETIFWDVDSSGKIYYIDNITFIYNQSIPQPCVESWSCNPWSTCVSNQQTRTCTDLNSCGTVNNKPITIQNCYVGHNDVIKTEILSQNTIRITSSGRFDMADVLDTSNYYLNSTNDAIFNSNVLPVKIGREFYIESFPGNELLGNLSNPKIAFNLYLVFNKNMTSGKDYILTVKNIKDDRQNNFPVSQTTGFNFNQNMITGTVKTNQVGYLSESQKFAYIGNYLGDLGPMEISPQICEIVNANSNVIALTVSANYRNSDPRMMTGEKLYDCNFTSLKIPGNYFVRVPGFGRTYTFRIGEDVFNNVFYKTARSLYYQRAGISLDSAHAGIWVRDAGHIITDRQAMIHISQIVSPFYNGEVVNSTVDLRGGWYDAGDYGKYTASASITLFQLLTVYEMAPDNFKDNQLNIPESGNGIPDILDEAKWELDWLKNMQAPDGGVYHKVATTQWASTMPAQDNAIRWISEKSTHATAQYAAALAKASAIYKPFNLTYANDLLARSEKAWAFLESHPITHAFSSYGVGINPPGIGGGENSDNDNAADEKAWAAAELYKATGKQDYNLNFSKYWIIALNNENWDVIGNHAQFRAAYTYGTISKYKPYYTDPTLIASLKAYIKSGFIDITLSRNDNHPYRSGINDNAYSYIGFGSFSQSTRYSWMLIMAYSLLNDTKYLDYAKLNVDVQLGNNPQYTTYITGVGYNSPEDPLSTISALDGIVEPFPGQPLYGVQYYSSEANGYSAAAQSPANLYPAMALKVLVFSISGGYDKPGNQLLGWQIIPDSPSYVAGNVLSGPQIYNGIRYWNVDFKLFSGDGGYVKESVDGYVAESDLSKFGGQRLSSLNPAIIGEKVQTITPIASYSNFRPVLRRYYDSRNLVEMGEYTIVDMGYTAAVYGFLSDKFSGFGSSDSGYHPADTEMNWTINANEFTTYNRNFKLQLPNAASAPTVNYYSRANYLFKMGERYHFDSANAACNVAVPTATCWLSG